MSESRIIIGNETNARQKDADKNGTTTIIIDKDIIGNGDSTADVKLPKWWIWSCLILGVAILVFGAIFICQLLDSTYCVDFSNHSFKWRIVTVQNHDVGSVAVIASLALMATAAVLGIMYYKSYVELMKLVFADKKHRRDACMGLANKAVEFLKNDPPKNREDVIKIDMKFATGAEQTPKKTDQNSDKATPPGPVPSSDGESQADESEEENPSSQDADRKTSSTAPSGVIE